MSNGLVRGFGHIIEGFPYAERSCPYCHHQLEVVNALHVGENLAHYKAIMICYNYDCGYYDMPCREAFVKVYYSSQLAADNLGGMLLHFERPARGAIQYDEITNPLEGIEGVYYKDEEFI